MNDQNRLAAAEREGRRHALCSHPAPADYSPEEQGDYAHGVERGQVEWEAHEQGAAPAATY